MDSRYKIPDAPVEDHVELAGFRDLERFTGALRWLLLIGAAISVIGVVSSVLQFNLLSHQYDMNEAQANDRREVLVFGAAGLLMLITLFVFGRWIVLAHRNLEPLGAQYLEFTPGWAVGWFFIPFANFWKPYQAMRFLWRASRDVHKPELQDTTWVMPTWWTLWLLIALSGNATRVFQGTTIAEIQQTTIVTLITRLLYLGLYLVAAVMVTRIWKSQFQQAMNPVAAPTGFADAPVST